MQCKKCKKEIPNNSVFCLYCGRKQSQQKATRRGNGLGTAYKRGAYWQAEVTLGYYTDDSGRIKRKRITKSGFKTKREALEYIEDLKSNKKPKSINFEMLWESFCNGAYAKLSSSKQTAYKIAWNKIRNEICFRDISDITSDELQILTDKYGTSYYTKRDIKNLLSHFYKLAMREEYVTINKSAFILLPELNPEERDIFTKAEIELIWKDYAAAESNITAHLLIMLYTGMRPGEMLTVLKSNVNFDEQYLTGGIKTEKSKKRKIILPDKIIPVIRLLYDRSPTDTLSPYKREDDFYNDWTHKKSELRLNSKLVPYCCRHTYVTNCTNLKISPAMLQELTGHKDYDTTLEYTHLSVKDRLEEVNKL